MNPRSGHSKGADVDKFRAPLPPPATFSRASTKDILDLNQQQKRDGDSSSDRSIRSEVFGGGEEAVQRQLTKQHRVKARQAAEEEKTLARKQRNQQRSEETNGSQRGRGGGGDGGDCCGSSVGSSIASFSTTRSRNSFSSSSHHHTHSQAVQNRQHEADAARLESLEGREEEKVSSAQLSTHFFSNSAVFKHENTPPIH